MALSESLWEIAAIKPENDNVTSVFLRYVEGREITSWQAGQYITIQVLLENQWSEAHPFTISAPPGEELLRVTIKNVGTFTSRMQHVEVLTPVKVSGPFGKFCQNIQLRQNIVMIAGGIGITPFLSILRHFRNIHATNTVTLFWANNLEHDIFAFDELQEIASILNIKIIFIVLNTSVLKFLNTIRPPLYVEPGYLTADIVKKYVTCPDVSVYLCGSKNMQDFVQPQLLQCGIAPENVEKEAFGVYMKG